MPVICWKLGRDLTRLSSLGPHKTLFQAFNQRPATQHQRKSIGLTAVEFLAIQAAGKIDR